MWNFSESKSFTIITQVFLFLYLDSEKFHEMAAATESPPKQCFLLDDDGEFPPMNKGSPHKDQKFCKKKYTKIFAKIKKFFFLSHKKKFEKIKIRFLLVVCCIPGKLFLTFQDIKNLCVNNSSRINPMNKQTVIALKNHVNVLFLITGVNI